MGGVKAKYRPRRGDYDAKLEHGRPRVSSQRRKANRFRENLIYSVAVDAFGRPGCIGGMIVPLAHTSRGRSGIKANRCSDAVFIARSSRRLRGWRRGWRSGSASPKTRVTVLFVQGTFLEQSREPTERWWAELRESPTDDLELPERGGGCDRYWDEKGIHPRLTKEVGRRAGARCAGDGYYSDTESGPIYTGAQSETEGFA